MPLEDILRGMVTNNAVAQNAWGRIVDVSRVDEDMRIATANGMDSTQVRAAYANGTRVPKPQLEDAYLNVARQFLNAAAFFAQGTGTDSQYRATMDSILGNSKRRLLEQLEKGNIDNSDSHNQGVVQILETAYKQWGFNAQVSSAISNVQNQTTDARNVIYDGWVNFLAEGGNLIAGARDMIAQDPYAAFRDMQQLISVKDKYTA